MGGACTSLRDGKNAYKMLVGKPEGNIPLGRQRRGCEGNIKMDLREIEWEDVDWFRLGTNGGFP
jgi:hypothetical protein